MTATTHNTTSARASTRRPMTFTRWGSRHLRTAGGIRVATGLFLTVLGALMLSRGAYGLATVPLAGAAVHFVWGSWQLKIARATIAS
jgi:hypothetical protein